MIPPLAASRAGSTMLIPPSISSALPLTIQYTYHCPIYIMNSLKLFKRKQNGRQSGTLSMFDNEDCFKSVDDLSAQLINITKPNYAS